MTGKQTGGLPAENDPFSYRVRDMEALSPEERRSRFMQLRDRCAGMGKLHWLTPGALNILVTTSRIARGFDIELQGVENIPDRNCLFCCNHSNSHDIMLSAEVMRRLKRKAVLFVASDGLSPGERCLFRCASATLIDRTSRESGNEGLLDFSGKMIKGCSGVIFPESTWNLHPFKPMQNIKIGAVKAAAIAGVPVVPTVFEYVEVPGICSREEDLYTKCVIRFGTPVPVDPSGSIIEQTEMLQTVMEESRRKLRSDLGIARDSIDEIDPEVYVNHTWLKKFGMTVFTYDSETESKTLRTDDGVVPDNEFFIDGEGNFRPGIIPKKPKPGMTEQ